MPLLTGKQLWDMWLFGNATDKISCLRYVTSKHDFTNSRCKVNYSKAKKVMEKLIELSEKSLSELLQLSTGAADQVFATSFKKLTNYDETTNRRYSELKYNTLHTFIKD
jgi:predicted peptidase